MKKNRIQIAFIALLVTSFFIGACSGENNSSTASKEPLRVEYTQWWPDYTLVVAKEKGFFDKYGVNVEPVYYEQFPNALIDLPAHKIDGGLLAIGDALILSQSTDLTIVASYDDGGNNTIVARPEIKSISDLKGQRIGVLVGTSYELFVRYMLEKAGLKPADVTLVNLDPSEIATHLDSGDIVAGYTWDTSLTSGYQIIFQKKDVPGLFPDVIVFREDVIQSRPEDVRAFLMGWFEAVEYRKQNHEETRQIAAKYTGLQIDQIVVDNEIHILNLQDNVATFQAEGSDEALSLMQAAQINMTFQEQAGLITTSPHLESFINGSFIK